MSSSTLRQIASHYLLTRQGFYKSPLITVDTETGRVVSISKYDSSLDSMPTVEFYSGILCPGFVNAHCHSELSYLRGAIPKGCGYAGFAANMAEKRGLFSATEREAAISAADRQMWNEGIVAVADIVNDNSSFAVKSSSKIFYRSFAEVFGLKKSNIAQCRELTAYKNTTLTPHSTYSVQDGDFRSVCNGENSPISIHFKESEGEEQLFSGYGPLAEWYSQVGFECDFLGYGSPARRIVESIPAEQSVMLVHNCFVTEADIELITNHFTAPVYWVLCPRSNRYISGKEYNIAELLRRKNLNICIGTDSLASNHSLSVIEELKSYPDIPLETLLTWACYNGAEALGIEPRGLINICGADLSTMRITPKTTVKRIL